MTSTLLRQPYFDFLRGVAIIMVVGIHTMSNTTPTFDSFYEVTTILIREILNCAVPLFLAISGYFIAKKNIDSISAHISFLKRQIPKVYIPCLIFSIPYLLLNIFHYHSPVMKSIASMFLCGFSVYYFVALIIQYYFLLPFLTKFNNWGGVILTSILSTISICVVTYIMKDLSIELPLIIYAGQFPLWIVFFFMGVYFSNRERKYSTIIPICIIVIGFSLQLIEYKYWLDKGQFALGIKLTSFIFSFGVILFLFNGKVESRYKNNYLINTINFIGGISFGIYLLHCYFILIIDNIFPGVTWAYKWFFVLSLTILAISVSKWLFPKFSITYLGFR